MLTLIIIHLPALLFSSNFHEHLFSLPFPANIAREHAAIFDLPDAQQQMQLFFPTEKALRQKLALHWPPEQTARITQKTTLKALCKALPGTPQEILQELLTYRTPPHATPESKQFDYEMCENLRKHLLLSLPKKSFLNIFEAYFQQEPHANREVISATVTRRFFHTDQDQKSFELERLARQYQTHLVYRVSLQRPKLLKAGIVLPNEVKKLLLSGHIGGIDLVGSLQEEHHTYPYTQSAMVESLHTLFTYCHKHHLILVLHLFEQRSEDAFYQALKAAVQELKDPLFLEVGHIAQLTPAWIDILTRSPQIHTLFHINITSNTTLHNTPLTHLQQTAKLLRSKGIPIAIGSDGRGILPHSSYQDQEPLLSGPTAHYSFLSMRDSLFITKYLTKTPL